MFATGLEQICYVHSNLGHSWWGYCNIVPQWYQLIIRLILVVLVTSLALQKRRDVCIRVITWFRVQFGINKHEQIFQRLQKIARARRASAICSLWKICECLFIPNCTRKIIWLLVNNIHAKIWVWFFFDRVYFVSRLTGPAYINIIGRKMTALIDMLKLVKK